MTLQEKIYHCRKKAGLSQEALAEKLGVSRQAVSKWETGEAAPEIGKLALLARTFGVSTDWLLSEEEDESAADTQEATGSSAQAFQQETGTPYYAQRGASAQAAHHDSSAWVDAIPGVIGKLLRRYGWLFGVYMAISGAAFTAMGMLIKSVFGQFSRTISGMTDGFPGASTIFVDGTRISSGFSSSITAPADIMGNFVLGIGLVLLIGGIVLAIVLKRQSR